MLILLEEIGWQPENSATGGVLITQQMELVFFVSNVFIKAMSKAEFK